MSPVKAEFRGGEANTNMLSLIGTVKSLDNWLSDLLVKSWFAVPKKHKLTISASSDNNEDKKMKYTIGTMLIPYLGKPVSQ